MTTEVTGLINRARTAQGLVPYKPWPVLAAIATSRAQRLESTQILTHGPSIGPALDAAGLQWFGWGENIGYTTYPVGSQAVGNLYAMWDASPGHHALMFSKTYNYVGVGFSTGPNGKTWSSIVFAETVDHTSPVAYTTSIRRAGTTLYYSWAGHDPILQTRTAGLRSFDLQYRVDRGVWRTIRANTTAMAIRLTGRAHGHTYGFRVRSRDQRGNLSAWTVEARIRVP